MWPYYKLAAGAELNELAQTLTVAHPVRVGWGRVLEVFGRPRRFSGRLLLPGGLEAFVTVPADVVRDAMDLGFPAPRVHPEAKIIRAAEALAPPLAVIQEDDRVHVHQLKRREGVWPLVSPSNYLKLAERVLGLKRR